ncbi:MAG: DNA repair protein RecN [Acidobacteria bacterium]|nr:MAG: DNA repair protein RecN [Acidobacteriota bacterium]
MLKFLSIENFALIESLQIDFHPGLTLITGETGSGKSILVDAVALLAGERASQEMVREGFEKARVEGIFALCPDHPARTVLERAGLARGEDEVVIRREISQAGTNKVFINNCISTQGFLAELGPLLADIHGQHDQQQLLQPRTHLEFLDAFGSNQAQLQELAVLFHDCQVVKGQLAAIRASEKERLQKIDTFKYQIEDIEKLALSPGLDQTLETERALLATSEKRCQHAQIGYQVLYEKEDSCLALLANVEKELAQLVNLDAAFTPLSRLAETRYQLEEIAYQLRDYADKIEFSPARLEEVEARLAQIQKAKRKYGASVDEILSYYEQIRKDTEELLRAEEQTEELNREVTRAAEAYLHAARKLSEKRRQDSQALCLEVEKELACLSMDKTKFKVELTNSEALASEKGIDEAEFLISANLGEAPKPLAKIASGGEISRIILALKSVMTLETYPKTLVFDEIDAGIGGRVASNVGEKLAALARGHQVFCVTHLPQIALQADQHYFLAKREQRNRTVIEIRCLRDEERVEELARMLAGESVTASTERHARELLKAAKKARQQG